MEKAKKVILLVIALAAGVFLLVSGLFSVISGTVADLATEPPPVSARDRVAFWFPYIQQAAHGSDPIQLVDMIMELTSTGNPAKAPPDGKNVGLMWLPATDGSNLDDPATNINAGVSILGPYQGGGFTGKVDAYFKEIGRKPPADMANAGHYGGSIFDVWVGNSSSTGNEGGPYDVSGADATVLAIAQGPDGTYTTSPLSTKAKPITWATVRLPDCVQPALPAGAKELPEWAREVTWSQAFYGPANPSSGNYLLYPGMYVYEIDVHAKSKDVKQVTIPFEAVWVTVGPKGETSETTANASVTINFFSSGGSRDGGSGGDDGSTVYTDPKALRFRSVDPNVIITYLNQFDSALANDSDVNTIISAAQAHGLNPVLMIAITGQEQDFDDRNNDTPEDVFRIEQNPYNVGGSWQDTDYPLSVSSDICANFLTERLSQAPPDGTNAIEWINDPGNPSGGLYASEPDGSPTPGWWEGVNYLFQQMDALPGVYTSKS